MIVYEPLHSFSFLFIHYTHQHTQHIFPSLHQMYNHSIYWCALNKSFLVSLHTLILSDACLEHATIFVTFAVVRAKFKWTELLCDRCNSAYKLIWKDHVSWAIMDLDIQFSMLYSYIFLQNLEKQVNQKSQYFYKTVYLRIMKAYHKLPIMTSIVTMFIIITIHQILVK